MIVAEVVRPWTKTQSSPSKISAAHGSQLPAGAPQYRGAHRTRAGQAPGHEAGDVTRRAVEMDEAPPAAARALVSGTRCSGRAPFTNGRADRRHRPRTHTTQLRCFMETSYASGPPDPSDHARAHARTAAMQEGLGVTASRSDNPVMSRPRRCGRSSARRAWFEETRREDKEMRVLLPRGGPLRMTRPALRRRPRRVAARSRSWLRFSRSPEPQLR